MKRGIYRDKTAQFYLVAAIIIIVIIFGIYTVRNSVVAKKDSTVVYDLRKEFQIESGKIDDFTLYNNKNSSQYLDLWIKTYIENKGQSLDNFIVAYGNERSIKLINYTKKSSGSVCLEGNCWETTMRTYDQNELGGQVLNIRLENITYEFNLESGKNFVFIIKEGNYVSS